MTEKDLISKLNNLKSIGPDESWLSGNRELLLSQISNSGAKELSAWRVFVINFQSVAKAASQPAFALGAFIVLLFAGSLFSHQLFNKTKPNDSLYIARIISEKAKLNTMLDTKNRDKLAAQFATEHAQEITAVLADPQFNNDGNKDQVARLNESFNQEISIAKDRLSKLPPKKAETDAAVDAVVSMADYEKDNQSIQISTTADPNVATGSGPALDPKIDPAAANALLANIASNTPKTATLTPETKINEPNQILDEAQKLFESKDYDKALDKLKEIDEMIKD